jgi:PAS domain S-box-containing protein
MKNKIVNRLKKDHQQGNAAVPFWNRFSTLLNIYHIGIFSVLLIVVSLFAFQTGRDTIEQHVQNRLVSINLTKISQFDQWTRNNEETITSSASRPALRENVELLLNCLEMEGDCTSFQKDLLDNRLVPLTKNDRDILALSVIRASDGQIIAATESDIVGKFREDESFFIEGKTRTFTENSRYNLSEQEAVMHIGSPIYSLEGKVIAVLAAHVNLGEMSNFIQIRSGRSVSEDTYLVNGFNYFVTEPIFGEDYALKKSIYTDGVQDCLQGNSGTGFYTDYRETEVVGAYNWMPKQEMCILSEMDLVEAYAPIHALRTRMILIGLGLFAVSILVGYLITRWISKPIAQLNAGAQRIGSGDLTARVHVTAKNEFRSLADSFNTMASHLEDTLGKNQKLVGELEVLNQDLESRVEIVNNVADETFHIVEQKRAEEKLLASELQFRQIVETAQEGIWLTNQDREVVFANQKFTNMLGYTTDELIGKSGFFFYFEEDLDFIQEQSKHRGKGLTGSYEIRYRRKDGSPIWFNVNASPLLDEQGAFTGTLIMVSDISQRKQVEIQVKKERDRAQNYLDIAGVMIVTMDSLGIITGINQKGSQVLGYPIDELIGKNWFTACVRPEDQERAQRLYDQFIAGDGKEGEHFEQIVQTRDGIQRITNWISIYLRDDDGNIIGTLSSGEDITEQKLAQQALLDSEARLRNIFENSTNMFYSHSLDRVFTFISPQSQHILGYAPEELIAQPTDVLAGLDENDDAIGKTQQAIKTGERQPPSEMRLRTKNGDLVWVEVREAPVVVDGKTVSIVGSLNDITERKAADQERERNLAALQIANQDIKSSYEILQHTMEATIRTIAKTVEVRDPYTAGHHTRVTLLAVGIANNLELDEEIIKAVELSSAIHDLGKIQVPAEILSKPGKLSDIEFSLVKTHPQVAYELLKDIDFPWPLADIIYMHHEKLDGSGYPRGLAGDEIAMESRILAVADTVEAMSSHRPYRPALGMEIALDEIRRTRGYLYDSDVVDACLALFESGYQLPSAEMI